MVADNPLLPHSNRITLKATIKHALDAGADAVVISDPETVMMTEQHDVAASMVKRVTPDDIIYELYGNNLQGDRHEQLRSLFGADWRNGTFVSVKGANVDSVYRLDKPTTKPSPTFPTTKSYNSGNFSTSSPPFSRTH